MQIDRIYQELAERITEDRLITDAPMKEFTSFKAGGKVSLLVNPANMESFRFAVEVLSRSKTEYLVMGNGSNLLVRDGGYSGVILRIGADLAHIETKGDCIEAEAGALLSAVADRALEAGLTGLEFASGIPGSLGGAVFMNAGAYGGEMRHVVESVRVLSKDGLTESEIPCEAMEYGYRKSRLMSKGDIAIAATLKLTPGDRETIAANMKDLAERRRQKQPLQYPSAGSFFKRPEGHYAGQLIEEANLKGLAVGGARISPMHAGFLINENEATASDILDLMGLVQAIVQEKTGVRLEPEVRIIGQDA